jgi:cytochrome P450
MRDLAMPFPVHVIAELLGIPPEMFGEFRAWTNVIMRAFSLTPDPAGADTAIEAMHAFFAGVVAERRSRPGDDLVSLLVHRGSQGEDPLSLDEFVNFCVLLLIAGNETTTNLLGNALVVLLQQPELVAQLRADPTRIAAFVEEILRYDSPVQSLFRGLSAPANLAGVELPEGARLIILLGSANRDERMFDAADEVRLERFGATPPDHVAFGAGIHLCLGAPLARLEARVALDALLQATSTLRPTGPPTRTASFFLRGCTAVPLEATPA